MCVYNVCGVDKQVFEEYKAANPLQEGKPQDIGDFVLRAEDMEKALFMKTILPCALIPLICMLVIR